MYIWGLHIVDAGIILFYVALILWIGKRAGEKTKNTGDFFLAGRKLGKFYQFFLNFGCSTNADQAVAVSREIYRTGIDGMWIQYLVLFLTPCFRLFFCFWPRFSQNQHPKRTWIDFMPNFTHQFKKLRMRKGGLCRNLIKILGNSKRIRSCLAQTGKS